MESWQINQGFQFVDTKNGNSRFVPIDQPVFLQIKNHLEKKWKELSGYFYFNVFGCGVSFR